MLFFYQFEGITHFDKIGYAHAHITLYHLPDERLNAHRLIHEKPSPELALKILI
jgi:hypothetical protein